MTNTHTPGPWSRNIPPARKYCVVFAGRNTHVASICSASNQPDSEIEANCNLIAAAPDLLAASRAALAALHALRDAPQGGAEVMLRAALAKAEGR